MAIPLGLVVVEVQVWKNIKGFSDMKYTNRESDLLSVLHIFYPKIGIRRKEKQSST